MELIIFKRKIPYFGVSITLEKQNIILGVIFNPLTNKIFYAQKEKELFLIIIKLVFQKQKVIKMH